MDCQLISSELVAYHFGQVDAQIRARVEAHLLECGGCLRAFLALKRELETAGAAPRPSAASRARLRAAVAQEVAPRRRTARPPQWWRKPLSFGFAAAACAASLLVVVSVRGQLDQLAQVAAARTSPPAMEAPAQQPRQQP